MTPLLLESSDIIDLSEYSKEYPWPLDYVVRSRDLWKNKCSSRNSTRKTAKEKKEIVGIIEKYMQGKESREIVDYWIYCAVKGILKSKDVELIQVVNGSKGIQDFLKRFGNDLFTI